MKFTYALGGPGGPRGMLVEGGANFTRSGSFGGPVEERREMRREARP